MMRLAFLAALLVATSSLTAQAQAARVLTQVGDWRMRVGASARPLEPSMPLDAGNAIFPANPARPGHIVILYCDLTTRAYTAAASVAKCGGLSAFFRVLGERFRERLAKGAVRGVDLPERVIAITPDGRFALDRLGVSASVASRISATPIDAEGNDRGPAIGPFAPADGPPAPAVLRPGLYRISLIVRGGRPLGDPGWVLFVDRDKSAAIERRFAEMEALSRSKVEPGLAPDMAREASSVFLRAGLGVLAGDVGRVP